MYPQQNSKMLTHQGLGQCVSEQPNSHWYPSNSGGEHLCWFHCLMFCVGFKQQMSSELLTVNIDFPQFQLPPVKKAGKGKSGVAAMKVCGWPRSNRGLLWGSGFCCFGLQGPKGATRWPF